ncbi:hypothetical protein MMC13_008303 [Lambiella insularis]|nr:hypothetical protein [Lambiella insularis]
MLLTSGQLSMTISSCIVFIFTSLLFLSGYVLQQQTVRNLQAAIHPPPPPGPNVTSSAPEARPFGYPLGSDGYASFQKYLDGLSSSIDWNRAAYVQLVTTHMPVCNAVMIFAELALQKSPARRVLLYPKQWDLEAEGGIEGDQELERTMRLIEVASERHDVIRLPIEPMLEAAEGGEATETAFPISGLLSLTSFNRLLYLRPSGLLIDSSILDTLFTIPHNATFISFSDTSSDLSPLTLINPSKVAFDTAMAFLRSNSGSETSYLHNNTHVLSPPSTPAPIMTRTSSLHQADNLFESSTFLSQAGYIQLRDPNILGPEYDIPRDVFLRSRPDSQEARRAWEELYEMYRMRRMNVCGLDLEPMPAVADASS